MFKKSLSVLMLLMIAVSIFTGCGSRKENTSEAPAVALSEYGYNDSKSKISLDGSVEYDNVETKFSEKVGGVADNSGSKPEAGAVNGNNSEANAITATTISSNDTPNNAILSQRKIIRNAFVSIEVENFDSAYGRIKSMISTYGFIQESNIRKDKVYVSEGEKSITRGTVIIRVDKDRFDSIIGDLKGLGTLINENIKSDDVTDKFFDTESRLRLIRYEESRLEEYLKKTADPDTIFKIESRLTDIRHEIENLTGTLNKMKDMVQLSTITIEMSEKAPQSKPKKEATYWERLANRFTESIGGVVTFLSELILVLVELLPVLVLVGIVIIAIVVFYKKVLKKRIRLASKKTKEIKEYYDENEESDEAINEEHNQINNQKRD
ncbi:DUF4349 domain-containing protein [Pseudobacteroides cellulosolvens]|uniref:DUF4349 domain-containing protein n=1 Tax=Pseudobacteroides cellulosolvens ATCC 35603 = DSM 2933 TaxID=398512 RepID=A0A0L6JKC0_9FIRM|nr:DUF4349 domain-containing protein [Pseudobacteroides cellulosolvens]KNY26306.1 protein of unknown function DUF4349 [Pseudobacteroides cellulosolvens ATCC 35603 = DSM 2933]